MAAYTPTVNSTPLEEKIIGLQVARVNADRAAQVPPLGAITNAQYVQALANQIPKTSKQNYLDEFRDRISAALPGATALQIQNAALALNITE